MFAEETWMCVCVLKEVRGGYFVEVGLQVYLVSQSPYQNEGILFGDGYFVREP